MPEYDDAVYKKNFLKQVIVRFDFVAPIPGLESSLPQKLAADLTANFPIQEPQSGKVFQINISPEQASRVETPFNQYNFFGRERDRQLTLASSYMFVLYNKYANYEEMRKAVREAATVIDNAYPDTRVSRFGLRYINTIEMDGDPISQWDKFICPDLLTALGRFDKNALTRWVQQSEMKCGELDLRFLFGLLNPDYPSVIRRAIFTLDFDAYAQGAHELTKSLQYMDQAHDCIQDQFERSITTELRDYMNA